MPILTQLIFNGLIAGAIYALVAAGFSLVYSTCKFVNFAHGAVVAAAAYSFYFFFAQLAMNFIFAVCLSVLAAILLGFLMNYLVYGKLRKGGSSASVMMIAGFALLTLAESLIMILFGADVKMIHAFPVEKGVAIAGALVTPLQLCIITISFLLFLFLLLFMKYTKFGKAMRAVADNRDLAGIVGVAAEKIYFLSFIWGSAIAGMAGILIVLERNLTPSMGTELIIKGFTGAIIGGIGSVYGAIIGSLFLGFAENFGCWYLPSGYKEAIAFLILIIFLLFRPQGILGIKKSLEK